VGIYSNLYCILFLLFCTKEKSIKKEERQDRLKERQEELLTMLRNNDKNAETKESENE